MKALVLALLLLWQAADAPPPSHPRFFRLRREVKLAAARPGQACAPLDAAVYAHAEPTLRDLRLFDEAREVPYAITLSEPAQPESSGAAIVNLGRRGKRIVFDLAMPDRPYTDVVLDIAAHNFIAEAAVSGLLQPGAPPTDLGSFTLFDLTAQRLSRSTTLHLQESRFPTLHVELTIFPAPGSPASDPAPAIITGAFIPPSREAQTVYTTIAQTTAITQRGRQTIAAFTLPAHVPVERVAFTLDPRYTGNFSRTVTITGHGPNSPDSVAESLSGIIERVRTTQAGREIREQQLTIAATLGANLQADAAVEVAIDNGDDTPIPLASVSLAMRERKLCFNAPADAASLTLFYGDAAIAAPVYDFSRVLSLTSTTSASLTPEQPNPGYSPRALPKRPFTERHPELLWVALLAVVCLLAVAALHSAKRMPK